MPAIAVCFAALLLNTSRVAGQGASTPTNTANATANLLTNGDIETGAGDAPTAWVRGADIAGVTYRWATDRGYESAHSLCLQKTAAHFFPIASWNQSFESDSAAKKLRVSAYIRADKVTKAVLDVSFTPAGADRHATHAWAVYLGNKAAVAAPLTHDWKRYTADVAIPDGTKTITVSPQIYGPGTVWMDDIRAEYVP